MIVVVQGTRPSRPPSAAFRLQAGGETRFHACGLLRWDGGVGNASVPGRLELTPSTPGTRFQAAQGMCEGEATLLAQSGSPSGTLCRAKQRAALPTREEQNEEQNCRRLCRPGKSRTKCKTAGGFADLTSGKRAALPTREEQNEKREQREERGNGRRAEYTGGFADLESKEQTTTFHRR
ncbi:hypothetical protein PM3016_1602 [Paenibacillus mucilaginosus 3016]|uniref:Uncharacterized protein n=1 Tax=Paenibacillus mucilaginosus 3016 TaxID=1116391 RepID=H6N9Z4_9BACL|nr:hypothetical protein [Paenibacillus mucilaginosus]AFC28522.1 hypothetical protein PM3016_1602 [Paenibacillus mucilaginosus 3016]WFA17312.1 hypothetical protein ERY13_08440 [Paenibacillus mucilaginosus]